MGLPIWAQQVWANQPDVQAIISNQQAAAAKNAQLALSGVQVQLEQQKLQADQRQFQESMAMKQQEMKSKAAAQAWEMQLAEKKATAQGLVDQANIARYNAMAANYGRQNQLAEPGSGLNLPPFPTGEEGAAQPPTEEVITETATELSSSTPLPFRPGITPFVGQETPFAGALTDAQPTAQPVGAGTVLQSPTPVSDLLSLSTQQSPQEARADMGGPNRLLPPAPTESTPPPAAVATPTLAKTPDVSSLPLNKPFSLGGGMTVMRLPGNLQTFGKVVKDKKTGAESISWGAPQPIVPISQQTSAAKTEADKAKAAAELEMKRNTVKAVRKSLGPEIEKAVTGWTDEAMKADFDLPRLTTAMNAVKTTAAKATETLQKVARLEKGAVTTEQKERTAQLKYYINLRLKKLAALSKMYEGRHDFLFPEESAKIEAKYQDAIKEPQQELQTAEETLEKELNLFPDEAATTAAPSSAPSSGFGDLRQAESAEAAAATKKAAAKYYE